jgi:hypothetical protein
MTFRLPHATSQQLLSSPQERQQQHHLQQLPLLVSASCAELKDRSTHSWMPAYFTKLV